VSFLWGYKALQEFCEVVGGQYIKRGVNELDGAVVPFRRWTISVEMFGVHRPMDVRMFAHCNPAYRFWFTVAPEGWLMKLRKRAGLADADEDLEVGDPDLDQRCVIASSDKTLARRLLFRDPIRTLLKKADFDRFASYADGDHNVLRLTRGLNNHLTPPGRDQLLQWYRLLAAAMDELDKLGLIVVDKA
jgi:hypothetical protein